MRIMTVLGTRPEIIRLSRIVPLLDRHADEHILVHTGQNYDDRLSQVFFDELGVRAPDVHMGVRGAGFGAQIGQMMEKGEAILREHRPDRLLILGDTNSGLIALVARRLGIPVYHMEAGNRCYDDRVPEEVNRRVIDHSSTILLPYTERSRANLIREGIPGERIYVTGNPIGEVMRTFRPGVEMSKIHEELGVTKKGYFLATLHRAENVDDEGRLRGFVEAFGKLAKEMPVVLSMHPRTQNKVEAFGIDLKGLMPLPPFGFLDFLALEEHAACVLSDSGTVQEEASILGVPNVTLRDVTERPETVECGSNLLAGGDPSRIIGAARLAMERGGRWTAPPEYRAEHVADTVVRIVLGYRLPDLAEQNWRAACASSC
jgi:UDP-N-acetylglucosamine 2-epimerase (non-hydrolysing)